MSVGLGKCAGRRCHDKSKKGNIEEKVIKNPKRACESSQTGGQSSRPMDTNNYRGHWYVTGLLDDGTSPKAEIISIRNRRACMNRQKIVSETKETYESVS
ncbi:hypothetical protein EVAR_32138_1 [Eumeta japonica]|uniref:Uncharacterized protein n=1 Tax=Eumeta variegata TaxID=151549 RepID=A0A4C1Z5V7_EUMVA|nr:hypothetical protein EVAR_32138_1 [Eumeta japonica]